MSFSFSASGPSWLENRDFPQPQGENSVRGPESTFVPEGKEGVCGQLPGPLTVLLKNIKMGDLIFLGSGWGWGPPLMSGAQGFREEDGPGGSATICCDEKSWASTETLSPPKPTWQTHSPQGLGLVPSCSHSGGSQACWTEAEGGWVGGAGTLGGGLGESSGAFA